MPSADFEDAFIRTLLSLSPSVTPADLIHRMREKVPPAFYWGSRIKNSLLIPFGFSPVTLERFQWTDFDSNQRVGEFKNTPFTAHIGVSIDHSKKTVTLASRVSFHTGLGKHYMALVKPFHKQIFKFLLNQL